MAGTDHTQPADRGPPPVPGEDPLRREVLAEIHARPFMAIETPRRIVHFAYLADQRATSADLAALGRFAAGRGAPGPAEGARHFAMTIAEGRMRWERHTEFTTYSWDMALAPGAARWADVPAFVPADAPPPPGPLFVALELLLVACGDGAWSDADTVKWELDPASLCVAAVDGGGALAVTDFQLAANGFTRVLVCDQGLGVQRAGVLVRRLVEVETYRTLAVLALPVVRAATPTLDRIEAELASLLRRTGDAAAPVDHKALLGRLTDLANDLERLRSETSYRLAAARAYHEIVHERLNVLGEEPVDGHRTWAVFLNRRLAPAMRTCGSFGARLESLSRQLDRAADLLRTRVDIALEAQNNAVLRSMNRRSQLQLRLQQTVEGLSIAAVSYYVVGLVAYLAKGATHVGLAIAPELVAAVSVPLVIAAVAWVVRRLKRHYAHERSSPAGLGEP